MIKFNKKLKIFWWSLISFSISLKAINFYKSKYYVYQLDLNSVNTSLKMNSSKEIGLEKNLCLVIDDPFKIINNFDVDDYFIKQVTTVLYTPPLTNKLFPKSNLYGHELIRYFDK
jgi:hypothetical protein